MKKLLSILLTGFAVVVTAQEIEVDIDSTYFHPAASMYVHGNSSVASNLVATGLAQFPNNGKLLRLKELLDQQQDQEQNEDKNKDPNEDQQDQDQDNRIKNRTKINRIRSRIRTRIKITGPTTGPFLNKNCHPPSAEQMSQDEAERPP